jgi:Fur family ferric uptake transcriptional regulator
MSRHTRRTEQRTAILEALGAAEGPLTAQEVHDRARELHPTIGLATVYRNLASLEADGAVAAVHLPRDATRYEPAGKGHHHHFRCVQCHTVFAVQGACPVAILEGATLPGGLTVLGHELVFFGKCATCTGAPA